MLRFAPSPTGDMNIEDLRIALFNYIIAKQKNENFIVRIEDTNKEKNIEGKDQEILGLLELFGLEYSQVVYQTQNFRFHSAMALDLLHNKKAFNCFCSDEYLKKKQKEAQKEQKTYKYDDACMNLPPELVIDNEHPFRVRIKRPTSPIVFKDYIRGDITFNVDDMESFTILNMDKTPTQNFASAVDDMLNDISIIIRKEEYIEDTPKQIHIRNELNYQKEIVYAHLPTIKNAKDFTIKTLLEDGFLPAAISNYLVLLGNETPQEIFTLNETIDWFNIEKIAPSSIEFDLEKLKKINQEHLKILDDKELSRYVGFADASIGALAKVYLQDIATTKELRSKIEPIFAQKTIPQKLQKEVELLKEAIQQATHFEEFEDFKNYLLEKTKIEEEKLLESLSILLTGFKDEKNIQEVYKHLKNYLGEIIK